MFLFTSQIAELPTAWQSCQLHNCMAQFGKTADWHPKLPAIWCDGGDREWEKQVNERKQ